MKSDGFKNIYFYALLEVEELITSVAIIWWVLIPIVLIPFLNITFNSQLSS